MTCATICCAASSPRSATAKWNGSRWKRSSPWVAEDFDGDEVIHPDVRRSLDAIAGDIRSLVAQVEEHEEVELELPASTDPALVESVKELIAGPH